MRGYRLGATLALLIGIAFAAVEVFAHPHPKPITCGEWCDDINCRCWDKCADAGFIPPNDCTVDCNAQRDDCDKSCGS